MDILCQWHSCVLRLFNLAAQKAVQRGFRLFWLGEKLYINRRSARSWLWALGFTWCLGVFQCYFYHLRFSWVFSQMPSEGFLFGVRPRGFHLIFVRLAWIEFRTLRFVPRLKKTRQSQAVLLMFACFYIVGDKSQELFGDQDESATQSSLKLSSFLKI